MSSNITVLCEDEAHFWFIRAYLMKLGYNSRSIRPNISVRAQNDAQDFVKLNYAAEMDALSSKNYQKNRSLVVILDADIDKQVNSEDKLIDKLKNKLIQTYPRQEKDRVAIFIPVRNIESWVYYIEHNYEKSIEYEIDYKKVVTLKPAKAAQILYETLCKQQQFPENMPISLKDACQEIKRIQ